MLFNLFYGAIKKGADYVWTKFRSTTAIVSGLTSIDYKLLKVAQIQKFVENFYQNSS